MVGKRSILIACLAFGTAVVSGCGLRVPSLTEIPGDERDTNLLVHGIVQSIHCEIRNALNTVIDNDFEASRFNHGARHAAYLDSWGVQVGLTLQIEEKTTLNPTGLLTPPGLPIFTLAGSASASASATRIDKLNFYYTVSDIRKQGLCKTKGGADQAAGSLLIQSDLKLAEWLDSQTMVVGTNEITVPISEKSILKQNALSHEVKFQIVSTGGITPAWKLTHGAFNPTGTLFSTTRDRLHDLLIVLGPVDPGQKDSLASTAQGLFLSSQLNLAVSAIPRLSN